MEKIFENSYYKLYSYLVLITIFLFSVENNSLNYNFHSLIIFLYSRDLILTNNYLNKLFVRSFKFVKKKNDFLNWICELSYILLLFFYVLIFILYVFLDIKIYYFWVILLIPFIFINSICLLLLKKSILKFSIIYSSLLLFIYLIFFKNYNVEIFLTIVCISEFIFIIFSLKTKIKKIKFLNYFNDMRFAVFFKKLFINLIISQFYKIIFIFLISCIYLFNKPINYQAIFYFIILIETADLFENYIAKKYWETLTMNFIVQKSNYKNYLKILKFTFIYFLIFIFFYFLFYLMFQEISLMQNLFYLVIFFSLTIEKIRNLFLLSMERRLNYKKQFFFHFTILLYLFIVISYVIFSTEELISLTKEILYYFVFYEIINLIITKNYITRKNTT